MNFIKTEIDGVVIIEPKIFKDVFGISIRHWKEALCQCVEKMGVLK